MAARFETNAARAPELAACKFFGRTCAVGQAYCPASAASAAFSQREVLRLVVAREAECGGGYERTVLHRPDVLLWGKDMHMDRYDAARVTVNQAGRKQDRALPRGDFHFVTAAGLEPTRPLSLRRLLGLAACFSARYSKFPSFLPTEFHTTGDRCLAPAWSLGASATASIGLSPEGACLSGGGRASL